MVVAMYLHVFELIYSAFGVAFPDFSERLILVPTLFDVLLVDSVHCRLACKQRAENVKELLTTNDAFDACVYLSHRVCVTGPL